jgi:hypothetical protein
MGPPIEDVRVTLQSFHGGKINTGEREPGGERMTEVMKAAAWDARPPDSSGEGCFDGLNR